MFIRITHNCCWQSIISRSVILIICNKKNTKREMNGNWWRRSHYSPWKLDDPSPEQCNTFMIKYLNWYTYFYSGSIYFEVINHQLRHRIHRFHQSLSTTTSGNTSFQSTWYPLHFTPEILLSTCSLCNGYLERIWSIVFTTSCRMMSLNFTFFPHWFIIQYYKNPYRCYFFSCA